MYIMQLIMGVVWDYFFKLNSVKQEQFLKVFMVPRMFEVTWQCAHQPLITSDWMDENELWTANVAGPKVSSLKSIPGSLRLFSSPWRKGAVWPWMVCENCCLLEVDIQLRYDLKSVKAVTVITIILLRLLKCETWVEEMVHKNWQKASPEPTFTLFLWFCFFFLMPYYYLRNTELLKCLMFSSYNVSVFH